MKTCILTIFLLAFSVLMTAQKSREWENLLYQLGEIEDIESSWWESYFEMLSDLEENPININTATREELEQLPFLTVHDVENINEYLYFYGSMKTLGELVMIRELDYYKRRLLFYFTYAGEVKKPVFPKVSNILKYGKHEFVGTGKIPFNTRKGDENGYEGYPYKHSVKYDFTYSDYVRAGFLGSQDAGEPFFAGKNKTGYDFYSFYVVLKKFGRIKTLALGRYRVRFGMGLVINNNFGFGKMSALSSMGRGGSNIRAHSSRSDGNYLQGGAATVNVMDGLDVSVFASYRKFDATLNKGDSTIATILSSGYHRTRAEMEKKNNSSHTVLGGNIDYKKGGFQVGATAVFTSLDKELRPNTSAVYRRHYAAGKDFYNIGLNYGYTGHRLSFNGETATGGCNAIATINVLSYRITDNVDLLALQRYYSYRYYSLFSESFSEGGAVQNESGVYLGVTWRPIQKLSIMAYTDYAYFAWPKYQAANTSQSFDNLIQAVYTPNKWTFSARYRLKMRERDNADKTGLIYKKEHRGRLSAAFNGESFQTKSQADISFTQYKKNSFGWMLSQNISVPVKNVLKFNAFIGYFNTADYDSRIYTYERGMLQSFSFPSFYGNGMRFAFLFDTSRFKNLRIIAKIGTTKYFDRDKIGSGYQQIDNSSVTDFELQVKWKF